MAMMNVDMEDIDVNKPLVGLSESEIQAEIHRVQRAITKITHALAGVVAQTGGTEAANNPYTPVLVSPLQRDYLYRSDAEINRMSEPDLLQEICNATALLMYYSSYNVEHDQPLLENFLQGNPNLIFLENSEQNSVAKGSVTNGGVSNLPHLKRQIQDWRIYLKELHVQSSFNSDDQQLYCVCKQQHHSHRPMIQCDSCSTWFHLTCINLLSEEVSALSSYVCSSCKGENSIYDLVKLYTNNQDGLSSIDLAGATDEQLSSLVSKMSEYQLLQEIERAHTELEKVLSQIQDVEEKMNGDVSPDPHYVDSSPEARSRSSVSAKVSIEMPPAGLVSPGSQSNDMAKFDKVFSGAIKRKIYEGIESGELNTERKVIPTEEIPTPQPVSVQPVVEAAPVVPTSAPIQVFVKTYDDSRIRIRIAWRDLPIEIAQIRRAGKSIDLCIACSVCAVQEGECACCDSCPRLFHPMCLDPPVRTAEDLPDQWFCPKCEEMDNSDAFGSPKRRAKRKAESPIPSPVVPPKKRGRPRKSKVAVQ